MKKIKCSSGNDILEGMNSKPEASQSAQTELWGCLATSNISLFWTLGSSRGEPNVGYYGTT
jgi:hypothetical protein